MWVYILTWLVGIAVGGSVCAALIHARQKRHSVGTLWVNHSVKDQPPELYLELHEDISQIVKEPVIFLEVRRKSFRSQETQWLL